MKHHFNIIFFVIFFTVLYFFKAEFWLYIIGFLLFTVILIWGIFDIKISYFLKSFNENKNITEKKIAITFDDGPTEFTPKFLELLKKNETKATFFCIGKQIEKYPDIFRKIIEDGHEIGNHTYSHSNKTGFFSTQKMSSEITKNDETILKSGNTKTELYRPPFGITNPNISRAIKKTEKKSIGWNIRSFDTIIENPDKITSRIIPKIKPGSIILLHDTSEKTLLVLEDLLLFLNRENYNAVTISRLFNFKK